MSLPHLLMLGLIGGASVGVTGQPPSTIGELDSFSIEQWYAVDYRSRRTRKLTLAEYRFLRGVIKIRKRDKLLARVDRDYYDRLERQAQRDLADPPTKRAAQ